MTVGRGESLALVGENGAGKSTLALVMLGVNQGQGEYRYDGSLVTPKNRKRLWRRIGMLFQDAADQLFCPSCWEEVAFGPRQLGCSRAEIDRLVEEAMEQVKMTSYEERVPLNMSGGERKRLAIAAALSMRPEVLVLDEPSAGLDPQGEELLLDILARLAMTTVLISHDIFFIQRLTNRTVLLDQGRVVRDYATSDFLADNQLESVNQLDFTYKNICHSEIMALRSL